MNINCFTYITSDISHVDHLEQECSIVSSIKLSLKYGEQYASMPIMTFLIKFKLIEIRANKHNNDE